MSSLADLGEIAKAQYMDQEQRPSTAGRQVAGAGAGLGAAGLGSTLHGLRRHAKHNKQSMTEMDLANLPVRGKGLKRMIGGGAAMGAAVPVIAAGGALGLRNRRNRMNQQEQPGASLQQMP